MQPIEIIEIDQDSCSLNYGSGACKAKLGETGDNKCFNTIGTCQYLQAYSNTTKTLKFCTNQQVIPADHLPFLEKVSITSAEINPGGANKSQSPLGKRATVSASFLDAPSTDRFTDKYAKQRRTGEAQASGIGYNPEDISTFWRKWKARNKYYLYRNMRYITAMIDDSGILHDVRTRHYVITSFSGPSARGGVNIGGKDILELLSKDKAEAPFVSQGKLSAEITESQTSITLTPSGIGAQYPSSGFVSIGKEICSFTRTGDNMTLVRARHNTERSSHKEGDTVQLCLNFVGQNVRQICQTLLTTYAKIPVEFLDLAGWQAEIDNGNLPYRFSALIAKPEKALTLISELMEQGYFYLWFDEAANLVRLGAVRRVAPPTTEAVNMTKYRLQIHPRQSVDVSTTLARITMRKLKELTVTIPPKPRLAGSINIEFRRTQSTAEPPTISANFNINYLSVAANASIRGRTQSGNSELIGNDSLGLIIDEADHLVLYTKNQGAICEIPLLSDAGTVLGTDFFVRISFTAGAIDTNYEAFIVGASPLLAKVTGDKIAHLDSELNFLKDSISISDKPDQIITRVVVNYGIINPLNGAKESNNFSVAELVVDLENEDETHARISNTKTIYSRWMHAEHGAAARELGQRLLDRYKVPPVNMSFSLAKKDSSIKLADFVRVKSPYQVDEIGNFAHLDGQIISAKEREAQHRFDYTMTQFAFEKAVDSKIKNIEIADDMFNVNVLTLYNNTISSPLNPGDTLNIIVRKNVIVGSRSNTVEAMYFPNFGVQDLTINLIIEEGAFIVGKGGDGASVDLFTVKNATDGGDAIKARNKINIDNSGTIGGGGGGGGGYTGAATANQWLIGMAGGGGAGQTEGVTGYIKGKLYAGAAYTISNQPNGTTTLGAKPYCATNGASVPVDLAGTWFDIDYPDGNGGNLGENGRSAERTMGRLNANTDSQWGFKLAAAGKGGKAIDGKSYVTYTKKGTIRGAEVN